MNAVKILIVDDHQIVRRGVARVIQDQRPEWQVCGEAGTGLQAIAAAAALVPQVVIMDISMPEMNGLEATRQILRNRPETKIVILTLDASDGIVHEVLRSGSHGYVLKSDLGADLIQAVETVCRHKIFLTSAVNRTIELETLTGACGGASKKALTSREKQVIRLIAEGNANKQVASVLQISVKAAETYRARVMKKLDLHSASDLIRYALRHNLAAI